MTPELKAKWITALRSGEYTQGQNYLKANGNYCCLGVLCEVYGGFKETTRPTGASLFNGGVALFNDEMLDAVGLKFRTAENLMQMNDAYRKSFNEIADWIEENL